MFPSGFVISPFEAIKPLREGEQGSGPRKGQEQGRRHFREQVIIGRGM